MGQANSQNKPRVLLMEPAQLHRRLLDAVLTAAGLQVIEAENWEQASFVLQEPDAVDLLIADVHMVPDGSRSKRLRSTRLDSFRAGSGEAMTGVTDSGVPCYLSVGRPSNVKEMVSQIRLLLERTSETRH